MDQGACCPRDDPRLPKSLYPSRGCIIGITEITSSRTYLLPDWVILEPREEELMSDRSAVVLKVTLDDPSSPDQTLPSTGGCRRVVSYMTWPILIVDSLILTLITCSGFTITRNYAKSTEGSRVFQRHRGKETSLERHQDLAFYLSFQERGRRCCSSSTMATTGAFTIKVEDVGCRGIRRPACSGEKGRRGTSVWAHDGLGRRKIGRGLG